MKTQVEKTYTYWKANMVPKDHELLSNAYRVRPETWLNFENFLADVGPIPDRMRSAHLNLLDKYDDYHKDNVVWAGVLVTPKSEKPRKVGIKTLESVNFVGDGIILDKSVYSIWRGMLSRCYEEDNKSYSIYKHLRPSIEWLKFSNFQSDMGPRPSKRYTLERVDNNKGYSKENCIWATHRQQANNRRNSIILNYNGESMPLEYWAEKVGIKGATLRCRLKNGWSLQESLYPTKEQLDLKKSPYSRKSSERFNRYEYKGEFKTLLEWSKILGIAKDCLKYYPKTGRTIEQAVHSYKPKHQPPPTPAIMAK